MMTSSKSVNRKLQSECDDDFLLHIWVSFEDIYAFIFFVIAWIYFLRVWHTLYMSTVLSLTHFNENMFVNTFVPKSMRLFLAIKHAPSYL